MWRMTVLTCSLFFLVGPSMAAAQTGADVDACPDSNLECTAKDAGAGPGFDVHYGVGGIYGLTAPKTTVEHHRGRPVMELPDDDSSYIFLHRDQATVESPHTAPDDTAIQIFEPGSLAERKKPTSDGESTVLRLHQKDFDPRAALDAASDEPRGGFIDDGDERILRIHEDGDGDPDQHLELTTEGDDAQGDGPPQDVTDFTTSYVDWNFFPVIEVLSIDGAITEVDAQRAIEADEEAIRDCFEPTGYAADGAVVVDLHLSYNGIVHSVNGHTDALSPNQARCILQRAWGYEFPRLAESADEPSNIQYRVRFIGQPAQNLDADLPNPLLLLERLRTSEPELDDPIADGLEVHLQEAQYCAAQSLQELPDELVVTEVDAQWHRSNDGQYTASVLDITVHNKTSSQMPSGEVVDCWEQALRGWDFALDSAEIDEPLPDEIRGSFFVTVRPGS